ncbi:pre-mRNA-splicing factor ATP-dependent RNA helicase DEAH10-like [Helianthus annuus]|uniref:pre-mRNA-splicing factor ATP-dependent RNA helicase DEAH10-like n=1 Tax=Helianthus annuus TaxID=4232 RepID=UPI000B9094B5|nr:pre-mRNA-splicing factor ATP-dependent RNA helicase DEAH10-like [Helianthus annuus]
MFQDEGLVSYILSYVQEEEVLISRTVIKSFSSPEGDHLTLVNVYRASIEFLEKNKTENGNEKAEKNLRKWFKDNFINNRSSKHARDKLEESRTVIKSFSSPEGDHLTLVNVYRASIEFLEKNKTENGNDKAEKNLRKWCKDNFINNRSLKHARDIYNQIRENVERMGHKISSCGDDMLQLRRCLAASYFLNAALKQPDGTYRVWQMVRL